MEKRFDDLINKLDNKDQDGKEHAETSNRRDERETSFKFHDPKEYAKNWISSQKTETNTEDNAPHKKRSHKKTSEQKGDFLDRVLSEIKGQTQAVARGVAPFVDLATFPVRKAQEAITGRAPMTLHEFVSKDYEKPDFKKEPLRAALHEGLEWAGATVPFAGVGSAIMKGAQHIPKVGKYISKGGEMLGGKEFNKALAGAPKELIEMTAAGIPMGMGAKTFNETFGTEPIVGDIIGGLTGGKLYGAARNYKEIPKNVSEFLGRLQSGDLGRSVRQSYLSNLKSAVGEENIDPLIEKIKSYKPVSEGHTPTVAEMTMPSSNQEKMYPQIAVLERANILNPKVSAAKGETDTLINRKLESLQSGGTNIEDVRRGLQKAYDIDKDVLQEVLDRLSPTSKGDVIPQDVGATLRSETEKHLEKAWTKRKAESEPHWEKVAEDERHIPTPSTRKQILDTFEKGIDDPFTLSKYERVLNAIGKGESMPEIQLSEWHRQDPKRMEKLKESGLLGGTEGDIRVSQLDAERKHILDAMQDAKNANNWSRHKYLKDLKSVIEEDLYAASEDARKAVSSYREYSPPINKIENVPSNAQMIKKMYGEPQVLDTAIGESFTRGSKAPEKVQKLVEAFKTRGEEGLPHIEAMRESITSEAKNELLNSVVNKHGLVDLNNLKRFKQKMTGAQEIDSVFVKDLEDLGRAQLNLENQFGREKGGTRDILLEGEPKEVVKGLLGAPNKQKALNEVLDRLKKVGEHSGEEGILNGVLEHMQETLRGPGSKRTITPHAYKTYMKKHGDVLKQLMPSDDYKLLEGVGRIMDQKQFAQSATTTPNSPTENLRRINSLFTEEGRGLMSKLLHTSLMSVPGANKFLQFVGSNLGKDVQTVKSEMLDNFLTDAAQALKDLKGTKNVSDKEIFDYAKGMIPRNLLLALISDDDKKVRQ